VDKEKNPFHKTIKISKEVNPQTGQMAMIREMTDITPTTAPMGINLGLYSSIDFTLYQYGNTKLL
jgi:hypothetical protein